MSSWVLPYKAVPGAKFYFNQTFVVELISYLLHSLSNSIIVKKFLFSSFIIHRQSNLNRTTGKLRSPEATVEHYRKEETQTVMSRQSVGCARIEGRVHGLWLKRSVNLSTSLSLEWSMTVIEE